MGKLSKKKKFLKMNSQFKDSLLYFIETDSNLIRFKSTFFDLVENKNEQTVQFQLLQALEKQFQFDQDVEELKESLFLLLQNISNDSADDDSSNLSEQELLKSLPEEFPFDLLDQ